MGNRSFDAAIDDGNLEESKSPKRGNRTRSPKKHDRKIKNTKRNKTNVNLGP